MGDGEGFFARLGCCAVVGQGFWLCSAGVRHKPWTEVLLAKFLITMESPPGTCSDWFLGAFTCFMKVLGSTRGVDPYTPAPTPSRNAYGSMVGRECTPNGDMAVTYSTYARALA